MKIIPQTAYFSCYTILKNMGLILVGLMLFSPVLYGAEEDASVQGEPKRLVIMPFTGTTPITGETLALLLSNDRDMREAFTIIVPRISRQDHSSLIDPDTIAAIGKQFDADFVVTGHIEKLGDQNVAITTLIKIETFQQIAGAYQDFYAIEDIRQFLPDMVKNMLTATRLDTSQMPTLAVAPFIPKSGVSPQDLEVLVQLLTIEIANSGKYAIVPRTKNIENALSLIGILRSELPNPDSIKAIEQSINAQWLLTGNILSLGENSHLLGVQIFNLEDATLHAGGAVEYQTSTVGFQLIPYLAFQLVGGPDRMPRIVPDLDEEEVEAVREEVKVEKELKPVEEPPKVQYTKVEIPPATPNTPKKIAPPFSFRRKYVEFGFGVGAGFSNDVINPLDMLQKHLTIDLTETLGNKVGDDGLNVNFNAWGDIFYLNVNMEGNWGFGLFASIDSGIYTNIPKSLFTLLSEGNINQHSSTGEIAVSGGIFADIGLKARVNLLKKLKIGVTPALYVPVVYVPKSVLTYNLEAEKSLTFNSDGHLQIYTPLSLNDIRLESLDINSLFGQSGFDVSLDVEYALFSFLDVGSTISHIPLSPAVLNYRMSAELSFDGIDGSNILTDPNIKIPEFKVETNHSADISYRAFRPLRFDFYARYKPLKTELLVLRPNIGFTVLNPSEEVNFNWGLEVRLNLKDIFRIHLSTGYEETLWKHRFGLAFNLRLFELNLEAGLRSHRFVNSFMLNGASVGLGICFGW